MILEWQTYFDTNPMYKEIVTYDGPQVERVLEGFGKAGDRRGDQRRSHAQVRPSGRALLRVNQGALSGAHRGALDAVAKVRIGKSRATDGKRRNGGIRRSAVCDARCGFPSSRSCSRGSGAQETRGNINGIVQDSGGVIPGATVRITNTDTSQTQQLVTNGRATSRPSCSIRATTRCASSCRDSRPVNQTGISLAVGQTMSLTMTLEVGRSPSRSRSSAESPLLDTTTVSSGQNFDRRMVEGLPMFSNMPIMLSRFTPGVAPAEAEVQNIFQGYMEGTTNAAGGQVGTGSGFDSRNTGNNYTIDGAQNNGFGRRIASSPNSDQIEEMRIETSNFDASQGHGTGLTVSMMTRGGTNTLRGSGNYTHWNNKLNSPNLQQKVTFKQDPRQEDALRSGREHIGAFTLGGPLVIPKVVDGRGKVFFFANYSMSNDSAPGRLAGTSTVPANRKQLEGDFSDLLLLPSGAGATTPAGHHQYQIFDPLTTRPDPLRPGRVIRDPFPGNIIPKDRFMNPDGSYKNPAFGLYQAMVPAPNQNFLSPTQQPTNNYYRAAEPDQPHNMQVSMRVDYNHSENSRFFIRGNGNKFDESSLVDWTYDSPDPQFVGLHDVSRARFSWSVTGTWTKVVGSSPSSTRRFRATARISATRARTWSTTCRRRSGLPSYMDDFCLARFECILPQSNIRNALPGHGRHGRRRHLGHDLSGAVEPHEHARVAHLARRRGRAVGPAHQPGRRREHGDVQLRQHVHPRGRHHQRVPGAANRLEPGRVHAGHADLGVDRRRPGVRRPQQLLRSVRAGHAGA